MPVPPVSLVSPIQLPPVLPIQLSSSIQIKSNDIWSPVNDYQLIAFTEFKNMHRRYRHEYKYDYVDDQGVKFTIKRVGNNHHGGIYNICEDGTSYPIADWSDVKVFLLNTLHVEWYDAYNYQTWAYFDYIYSNDHIRRYKSRGTFTSDNYIEIPIDGLELGIIFSISRNENDTIYYEKNDAHRTKVRICDNEFARRGYYGFYRRMTADLGMVISYDHDIIQSTSLSIPDDVETSQTLNDDIMCIVCKENKQNIKFEPCDHTYTCSVCYLQLVHSRECPVCKQTINNIISYTPIDINQN